MCKSEFKIVYQSKNTNFAKAAPITTNTTAINTFDEKLSVNIKYAAKGFLYCFFNKFGYKLLQLKIIVYAMSSFKQSEIHLFHIVAKMLHC